MKTNYLLNKTSNLISIKKINYSKLNGFRFKPNNSENYFDMKVDEMVLINESFVEVVLKKKIKKRLELYLRFIISLLDEDNDTDITNLRAALNDLTRYKDIIKHKYNQYLDRKYTLLLLKKIELLENELKSKIFYYKEPEIKKEETQNHRRR